MKQQNIASLMAELKHHFDDGRTYGLKWRRRQLDGLTQMLKTHQRDFEQALGEDMGKPSSEAMLTELSFAEGVISHTRRHLKKWARPRRVHTPAVLQPGRSYIFNEPLGTVLIISPWNYPVQLCLSPLAAAISAGNCAVIKPSELAPASSALLARLIPQFIEQDCYRVVEGGIPEATALLEQRFDHIIYTGGERVARIVMMAAAQHLTPVTLELGGKSPCIVLPDADLEVTARRIVWGKFTNAGQTCIAPYYILTDKQTEARLLPALAAEIQAMYGSNPQQSNDYGRIVNTGHFDRLARLFTGHNIAIGGDSDRNDRYISPTVLTEVSTNSALMSEEIFGPLLPIVTITDLDSAVDFVRQRPAPLAAYLFTANRDAQKTFSRSVSCGNQCINDVVVFMANHDLPFGGVGASGMGTYKGKLGFENLTNPKSVLIRSRRPDVAIRYAPYTKQKLRWMRRLA